MSDETTVDGEPTRPTLTRLNDDGSETATSVTTDPDFKIRAECLLHSRLVIPIVFLPGIMGTRLRLVSTKGAAWLPPEGTWETITMALAYLVRNAAQRQIMLDPNNTEVDDDGPARPSADSATLLGDAPGDTDAARAKWRGWGQVHSASYSEVLAILETRLAHMLSEGCVEDRAWKAAVTDWQTAELLGAQKSFSPIESESLKKAASASYPVHVVGYNWLRSNADSAQRLASEIERIIGHYADRKKVCERVIVVTHSMGGLVLRACFQLPGMAEKILGVVHGVMPAIGAPATYKRMRAGFEGAAQVVMGRNAAECTAVLANAPGPLELLPTAQYRCRGADGIERHWLRASCPGMDEDHKVGETSTYFGAEDPFREIYMNNNAESWWRLVKEELVNPAKMGHASKFGKEDSPALRPVPDANAANTRLSDFDRFALNIDNAQALQSMIEEKYHPRSYAFYSADAKQPSWNEVHWRCAEGVSKSYAGASTVSDDLNGEVTLQVGNGNRKFTLQPPLGSGDGTVPEESGRAPTPFMIQMFRHEGKAGGHESYDHQLAFGARLTQAVTLYSIAKLASESNWLEQNLGRA